VATTEFHFDYRDFKHVFWYNLRYFTLCSFTLSYTWDDLLNFMFMYFMRNIAVVRIATFSLAQIKHCRNPHKKIIMPSFFSYFWWLNARIESRENWMPEQNGRLDGAGGGIEKNRRTVDIYRKKWIPRFSVRLASLPSLPPPPCASRSLRSLFLSHALKKNRQIVNSPRNG